MHPSFKHKSVWVIYSSVSILGILVVFGVSSNLVTDSFDGIVSGVSAAIGGLGGYIMSSLLVGIFSKLKSRTGAGTAITLSVSACALFWAGTVAILSLASKFGLDIAAVGFAGVVGGFVGLLLGVGSWYGSAASRALLGGVSGAIAVGISLSLTLELTSDSFNQFLERTNLAEFPGGLLVSFKWHVLGILAGILAGLVYSINEDRKKRSLQRNSRVYTVDAR